MGFSTLGRFTAELKRRSVFRVAAGYAVFAWLVVQVSATTFPYLDFPSWAVTLVIVLAILGFPLALVLAWVFDITPGGVVRSDADAAAAPEANPFAGGRASRTLRIGILVVVLGLAGSVIWSTWQRVVPGFSAPESGLSAEAVLNRAAIAVLPFQNLSGEGAHPYFAAGLHDEVLTQLSKVAALTVISRTSVLGYEGTRTPLGQIARELGVGTIVEGSVQVLGARLRVIVQLIDASTGAHLWAERYDRTLEDAFAIQSDIAQQVVVAIGAKLGSAEQRGLADAPTANAEAYLLYLQGRDYLSRPRTSSSLRIAQQHFEQALVLDPRFALASAALSEVHGWLYWTRDDPTPARAELQRQAAEAALRDAPDLPQAHAALGYVHLWGRLDYRRALESFETALAGLPNDAQLWVATGYAHRRLGNWDELDAVIEKAAQLDPRNVAMLVDLVGNTRQAMHRHAEAVQAYDRALRLVPDNHTAALSKALTFVRWQGQLDSLRAALTRVPADVRVGGLGTRSEQHMRLLLWAREPDSLLHMVAATQTPAFEWQGGFVPAALYAAWAHRLRGDTLAEQAAFTSALEVLDSVVVQRPYDWRVSVARGFVLAGLGRRDEALREARWLERTDLFREDAYFGPALAEERAKLLTQAGAADAALAEIERLLAGTSLLTVHTLRLDPLWDPLRPHRRFQALLQRYARR